MATARIDSWFLCCSGIRSAATMQLLVRVGCLAVAVAAFQPPAAQSQQLTQMYGFDNPASRPKYDHSVQPSNGTAACTVSCTIFDTRRCRVVDAAAHSLSHYAIDHDASPPRPCRRSQVEQGRLQAGARIARRRHALDDPAEGPVAGHGLREDGRLLWGPRSRRRCGAGLPGLGVGCRQSSGLVRSSIRNEIV